MLLRLDGYFGWLSHDLVKPCLHIWVVGTATAFGGYPHDVLSGVFDIAGFAMYAVLRVDLQSITTGIVNILIDTGGAVA